MLLLELMKKMAMMIRPDQDVISEGDMILEVLDFIKSNKCIATGVADFEGADFKNDLESLS